MDIVTSHPIVDAVLEQHAAELGAHAEPYRNHVYRGLNYQQLLLGESLPDTAALAWAVHDLGVWTAGTFDYLAPSAALGVDAAPGFGIDASDAVRDMVIEHHRLRRCANRLTETFRLADRMDVSRGVLRGPVPASAVKAIVRQYPYRGFHGIVLRGGLAHALRHPLNPLPMVRW